MLSDRHIDHKLIFEASMVATRPNKKNFPKFVFLYETLSETHWNVGNIEPNFILIILLIYLKQLNLN